MGTNRTVIDISSLCYWTGSPTGMIRTEHEVAKYALQHLPDCAFSYFDPNVSSFIEIRREWVSVLIQFAGILLPKEQQARRKRLLPGRRVMFLALESKRIQARSHPAKWALAALQRVVSVGRKMPFEVMDRFGNRLDLVRYEDAVAGVLVFQPGDTLLLASSDWWHKTDAHLDRIAAHARQGLNIVALCYDILPLIHPEWFGEPAGSGEDIKRFKAYWSAILRVAARVIVNSNRVQQDLITYCATQSIVLPDIDVVPLGSDVHRQPQSLEVLPPDLMAGHFALYVSTIEPRKNHALLLRCWKRLVEQGLPQRSNFKLVIVGRSGWRVEAVLADLRNSALFAGTVRHYESAAEPLLESLYAGCAFCVYPSEYEGFGLPIVEAFSRGKAVIASTGGSLPEVVGDLSPLLDPYDEDGWTSTLGQWIENPEVRLSYERAVADRTNVWSWQRVSMRLLEIAVSVSETSARSR